MKRATFTIVAVSALTLSGCSMSDMIYAVFSEGYTGGGPTEIDKKRHYDQQVEASRHYSPWQP